MNQAKDNYDKDATSVSQYDGNTHAVFEAFKKEQDENKRIRFERMQEEMEEYNAVPKEVREA